MVAGFADCTTNIKGTRALTKSFIEVMSEKTSELETIIGTLAELRDTMSCGISSRISCGICANEMRRRSISYARSSSRRAESMRMPNNSVPSNPRTLTPATPPEMRMANFRLSAKMCFAWIGWIIIDVVQYLQGPRHVAYTGQY